MHGDHVLAKIQRLGGVTGAQRAEGRIIRVLDARIPRSSVFFATALNTMSSCLMTLASSTN